MAELRRPLAVWIAISCLAPAAPAQKRLAAYYFFGDQTATPSYTASQIPYSKLTHLIHVAIQPAPEGDGGIRISQGALEPKLVPKAHKAHVKVLVCVQGEAALFRKIAANPQARQKFAENLKEFVDQYKYDGVDIDWEVPQGAADVANCTELMRALRRALPAPKYLLSMATPSTPGRWGEFDFRALTPVVDFFNVMTYDFHGPWTDHTGHNSPLFSNGADGGHDGSLDDSVNLYLNQLGVPPEKINLGTAFYGYEFPAPQLWASCTCEKTTISRHYGPYIKPRIDRDGWVRAEDPISLAPYLIHQSAPVGVITYDDPASTMRKVIYALEVRNLGGVFMWELSQDYDGRKQDLMNAMSKAFRRVKKETR